MKADCHCCVAELKAAQAGQEQAAEDARAAYEKASKFAEKDLAATHPIRLDLAFDFSTFQYEILSKPEYACRTARTAFEDALAEIDEAAEEFYEDTTSIMKLLRDNVTLWETDRDETDSEGYPGH